MANKVWLDSTQVLQEHQATIYRLCKAYMGDGPDLDDVHQEVLINVWKSLKSFRGEAKLTTWIYRITVNTVITHRIKQAKRKQEMPVEDLAYIREDTSDRESKLNEEQRYQQLQNAVEKLKPDQRIIIGLYLEDLSYKDIAEVIGKDTNYVGVKLKRIKNKLTKLMS